MKTIKELQKSINTLSKIQGLEGTVYLKFITEYPYNENVCNGILNSIIEPLEFHRINNMLYNKHLKIYIHFTKN